MELQHADYWWLCFYHSLPCSGLSEFLPSLLLDVCLGSYCMVELINGRQQQAKSQKLHQGKANCIGFGSSCVQGELTHFSIHSYRFGHIKCCHNNCTGCSQLIYKICPLFDSHRTSKF